MEEWYEGKIEVGDNESAKYWLSVMNNLKNRGVRDVLILCADGLTEIKEAIKTKIWSFLNEPVLC